jgi:regulator of replication initiation timing
VAGGYLTYLRPDLWDDTVRNKFTEYLANTAELEKNLKESEQQCESVKRSREQLSNQIHVLEKEVAHLRDANSDLLTKQETFTKLHDENRRLTSDITQRTADRDRLLEQVAQLQKELSADRESHAKTRLQLQSSLNENTALLSENNFLRKRSQTLSILQLPAVPLDAEIHETSASELLAALAPLSEPVFQATMDEKYKGRWTPKPGWPAILLGPNCPDYCDERKKHIHFTEGRSSSINIIALTDSKRPDVGTIDVTLHGKIVSANRRNGGTVILESVQILPLR